MLVVVAIIGIFSLVSVPPFMQYMRQVKVRSATRRLNTDLRFARQRAISRNAMVSFSFTPGNAGDSRNEKAQYSIYDQNIDNSTSPPTITWTRVGPIRYLEGVYFLASEFAIDAAVDDAQPDVVFRPIGTIDDMPANGLVGIRTERDIPNNHVTDQFSVSGSFKTVLTTD
jgi:type II secretory pathway pseudopilin PulG